MSRAALYVCYDAVTEPLVQTQVVAYLRELASCGFETHLLTFEKDALSPEDRLRIREDLERQGIRWHALRYHARPSLPATLFDIVAGTLKSLQLCARHGIGLIHARSHVPATMGLVLKRLSGRRLLFDLRGLLADEYADAGHWTRTGLKYRLTKGMERILLRQADSLVVLTRNLKEHLTEEGAPLRGRAGDITVIPCCVDTHSYALSRAAAERYRSERTSQGRVVLAYVGKIGHVYMPEEMLGFFTVAHKSDHRFFLQVLTQSDPGPLRRLLGEARVAPGDYDIRFVEPAEVPVAIAAADATLCFRRGGDSRRGVSPTKLGESLAAGLPVVANAGIGDCDALLEGRRVGVVVRDLSEAGYRAAVEELCALLEDGDTPARCRRVAEEEFSLVGVGGPRYATLYGRLLEGPVDHHA